MLEDPAGVGGQEPIIRPKGDEEEQHPGAPEDPGCQGSCSSLHGAAGAKPAQGNSEKEEKPRVSRVSGRAGPEKCYFWVWVMISWLVWVSVGGGAGLIKADDLVWASSCGIKDHDKQLQSHPRGHMAAAAAGGAEPGTLRTQLRVTSAEFLGHQGVTPIPPCTHKQRWTQRSSPHPGARGVLSHCGDTPQMALLGFAAPSSSEQNSDVAFTESNPRDARKAWKHWEILNIPVLLGGLQPPPAPGRSTWSWTRSIQPGAHMDTPGMSCSCKWCSPSCHGKMN